jgi:hypothetical protein
MSEKDFLVIEYDKLKAEQTQRIGFRDNLIFVHLAAVGAVASWVLTNKSTPNAIYALLVIPWVCLILGWTYVVNDSHVSRIGKYVRTVLGRRASGIAQLEPVEIVERDGREFRIADVFGWESFHRIDKRRISRKIMQCVIDEATFFLPGVFSLLSYGYFSSWSMTSLLLRGVIFMEAASLLGLFLLFIVYADFDRRL